MAARRDRIHRLEILQARDRTIGGSCQESTGCGPLHLKAQQGKPKRLVTPAAMLRVARWREMASNLSKEYPHWDDVRIAHHSNPGFPFGERCAHYTGPQTSDMTLRSRRHFAWQMGHTASPPSSKSIAMPLTG